METTTIMTTATKIAGSLGLTESDLFQRALASFLHQQKRETLQYRLDILARYGADSIEDLETMIAQGKIVEHPAWEDLITAENLAARLEELDAHLDDLQVAKSHRAA